MCSPTTMMVASLAMSAVQGYSQYQDGKYQNELAIEEAQNANTAYIDQTKQVALADIQRDDASAQKLEQNAIDAAQARGRAITSAGEAGVSGVSVDMLLNDFYRQEARFADGVIHNNYIERAQSEQERLGLQSQAKSRVNSAMSRYNPNVGLGAALTIGDEALSAGSRYYNQTRGNKVSNPKRK